jgi:hypothetical protein
MERKTWDRQAARERGIAPSPELFAGERILGTVEAGLWDMGWLGFLLRRKERLVVTTHRLMQYSTNFVSSHLKCLELAKVEAVEAGSKLNIIQFVAGVILLLGAMLLVGGAISNRSEKLLFLICSSLSALAGLFALMTSEKKVLQVLGSSPQNSVRLPLARLSIKESKSFIDLVSGAARNVSKATPATAHQAGRKPAEALKNSKNGNDVRARVTQPPLQQSYHEAGETISESFSDGDNRYRNSRFAPPFTPAPEPSHEPTGATNTPPHDDEYLEYRTSPTGEGWYRASSRGRRMYIE